MVAIYAVHYNFLCQHKSLNKSTPAMAAGISKTLMSWPKIVKMMDEDFVPKKRGSYKKKNNDCGAVNPKFTIYAS